MVRAVTRVKYCVEKLVETAVKEDADELIGSDGGPTFMDCLKACQERLRVVKARSKAACCAERMFPTALRRENRQRKPLKSVENVVRGDVLQVLGSMDSVEEACRKAGVRVESYDRMQLFLNAFVRVIAVESRHLARCRLVGVGDFVFPASAFSTAIRTRVLRGDARPRKPWLLRLQYRWPDEPFGSPSWEWEDNVERPELQDLPDEGMQELLHKAKYHRRNVEDLHSAL